LEMLRKYSIKIISESTGAEFYAESSNNSDTIHSIKSENTLAEIKETL
jgi:hypothetical protein